MEDAPPATRISTSGAIHPPPSGAYGRNHTFRILPGWLGTGSSSRTKRSRSASTANCLPAVSPRGAPSTWTGSLPACFAPAFQQS